MLRQLHSYQFGEQRATGLLDGGAPFYNVYTCADGRWMSVACIEPQFFREFLGRLLHELPSNFDPEGWRPTLENQFDRDDWPRMKEFFERAFRLHPRDHWAAVFHGALLSALSCGALTDERDEQERMHAPCPFSLPAKRLPWQEARQIQAKLSRLPLTHFSRGHHHLRPHPGMQRCEQVHTRKRYCRSLASRLKNWRRCVEKAR